jgi:AcrR family transcriptional regulator
MPPLSHTSKNRREQIQGVALRVFAQKGFANVSNRDIAQEAGITTGLIYDYFEKKVVLLQTILEERLRGANQQADERRDAGGTAAHTDEVSVRSH